MFCLDLELVEQLEDQAIDENGLKYLRNIEIQTETPEIGLMQIPDTRIEVSTKIGRASCRERV